MYSIIDMRLLQLFAEGEGEGASGAAGVSPASGASAKAGQSANAADAERQRLLDLGVPEEKLNRRARYRAQTNAQPAPQQDAAAESPADGDDKTEPSTDGTDKNDSSEEAEKKPARMTWEEIKADPEYNKEISAIVSQRVKAAKASEEALQKLTPALEVLARKYGLDADKLDYDALAKAVSDDSSYYENRALEMGVPVETAKRIDQQERDAARQKRIEQDALERQRIEQHIAKLQREGDELKQTFPNFNLRQELNNPVFARMTSPGVGLSVADAYYAVHRNEIQAASMQVAAKKTAEKLSNSIAANSGRPQENGTSSQAPSVSTFDYRKMSKAQREDLKRRIRDAAARGEKLYPGQ